jgi:SulP family sulfate permease
VERHESESLKAGAGTRRMDAVGLRTEVAAGLGVACLSLPICLATGLLIYGPLGPAWIPAGIAASFYGYLIGGAAASLCAPSSFVISSPRASTALIQASLVATLASQIRDPVVFMAASAVCLVLAGIWQLLLGALGFARVIKFTPHPVLAGFINGVALLIILSQLRPFMAPGGSSGSGDRLAMLVFVLILAAVVVYASRRRIRVPASLLGLIAGVATFHALRQVAPSMDLGPLIGAIAVPLPPHLPPADLLQSGVRGAAETVAGAVVLTSFALALVATTESLLSFRAAQNLLLDSVEPRRALVGQGIGNVAAGLCGAAAITASPLQTSYAYRAGGRTRIVALSAMAAVGMLAFGAGAAIAAIPVAVVSALLLATGVLLVDTWSIAQLRKALRPGPPEEARRTRNDLAIMATVMILTAAVSIVAGIVAGVLLACLVFIVNMSRPIVRRETSGAIVSSRRVRAPADADLLLATGERRRLLELQGVLFFGNADDLSHRVRERFAHCDSIVLDLRGVSDIDATGGAILEGITAASQGKGTRLVFCNVPAPLRPMIAVIARDTPERPAIFADLDTAFEVLEEDVLRARRGERDANAGIDLAAHPFLEAFDAGDREAFARHLVRRNFPAGAHVCEEGEDADRMWLLTRGSISVRVRTQGEARMLRLSSRAPGTTVGEMALLQFGRRSASLIADEEVEAWEMSRESFERLASERPAAASKAFRAMAVGLGSRLRGLSDEFRH